MTPVPQFEYLELYLSVPRRSNIVASLLLGNVTRLLHVVARELSTAE